MKITISLDSRKKNYFHCTQSEVLKEPYIELSPRGYGCNRSDKEPIMYRICVSQRVSACIAAIGLSYYKDIVIYACKARAWTPYGVMDSEATGEKWITEDTEFVKIATLNENIIKNLKFCDSYATKNKVLHNKKILKELYEKNLIVLHEEKYIGSLKKYL